MKTIKVIDLLNKIANGEEVPKKITIDKGSYEFEWNGNMYIHRFRNKYGDYCDFVKPDYIHNLDKEIHIIEDTPKDKKIEELSTWFAISDAPTLDGVCKYIDHNTEMFYNKINELVRKVNGDK